MTSTAATAETTATTATSSASSTTAATSKSAASLPPPLTDEMKSQLQTCFDQFDTDNNGSLDQAELRSALKKAGYSFNEDVVESLYKLVHHSEKGGISFVEFVELTHFISFMQETFNKIDTDNSGDIDKEELTAALTDIGYDFKDPLVIKTLISAVDDDENGAIDFEEFIDLSFYLRYLRSLFTATDTDNSGTIDRNELTILLKKSGLSHTPETVSQVLSNLAGEGAKVLNFEQFVTLVYIIEYGG